MTKSKLHFHSMIVHAVVAFSPVAAISYIFSIYKISFLGFNYEVWQFILFLSLIIVFLTSIPATISGISELRPLYVKWHRGHKLKLILSILLIIFTGYELFILFKEWWLSTSEIYEKGLFSLSGLMIIVLNNLLVFLLSYYGLHISLGRQSFQRTSYVPDFFNKEKPIDILKTVKEEIQEGLKIRGLSDISEDK